MAQALQDICVTEAKGKEKEKKTILRRKMWVKFQRKVKLNKSIEITTGFSNIKVLSNFDNQGEELGKKLRRKWAVENM